MDLDDLLKKTSRTFALAIPMLPEPTRRAVSVAYLLFRIADTFEDATDWPSAQRIEALHNFAELLELQPPARTTRAAQRIAQWLKAPPVTHEGYLELLRETAGVLHELDGLAPGARAIVVRHSVRTTRGMADVVHRADERGNLRLGSRADLTEYCYIVAGIVGELLTDLFLHDTPALQREAEALTARMKAFGEGLQLVNILKDSNDDARDGRVYLPPSMTRGDVLDVARRDLDEANDYVQVLQRGNAPRGYLGFTGISLLLAYATLNRLEEDGPGAKVSRADVARLYGVLQSDLASGAHLDLRARAS